MQRHIFPLFAFLFFASIGLAQNCDCPIPPKEKADHCFMTDDYYGKCAYFVRNVDYFWFHDAQQKRKKRRIRKIPMYDGQTFDEAYLLTISKEKKLKLETADVLFIKEALNTWDPEGYVKTASGLRYQVIEMGEGALPEKGKSVSVHYKGYLEDGTVFDDSYSRGSPFAFKLGKGRVIKGWDEGIALFRVGTRATLKIPPELGYGSRSMGKIPANSTLYFDIEVMDVK